MTKQIKHKNGKNFWRIVRKVGDLQYGGYMTEDEWVFFTLLELRKLAKRKKYGPEVAKFIKDCLEN